MPMYPLQNICTKPWIYRLKSHFNVPISYFTMFYFSSQTLTQTNIIDIYLTLVSYIIWISFMVRI